MKFNSRLRLLRSAVMFSPLALTCALLRAAAPPETQVINPYGQADKTLPALLENKAKQIAAAKTWNTFHDFQFTERYEQSGIRFEQRSVDDGAKNYKAVHYDHGTGLAVADVDGDGRLDIYFVNQLGGNQLWRNLGGGKFENITAAAGVGLADKICVSASFADIDNDGRPDLFVTTVRMGNFLFRNLGRGQFQDVTAQSGLSGKPAHSSGAAFLDFNRDGLLDLFVANVGSYTRGEKGRGGFYLARTDAFQGWQFPSRSEQSILYQNLGGGKFQDVSRAVGLEHRGWSGDVTFCDLNHDGYPEIYVPSMSGVDRFYDNERGRRFADKTATYFPKTPWGSMGVKFFDYNLDGLMDLYVTDMHSDMTTLQIQAGDKDYGPAFEKQKSDVWCSTEWTPANWQNASNNNLFGNAFYQNQGQAPFLEISAQVGAETYWPWGISVGDLNADGYEDVFVTAGMGYPLRYAINSVLLNEGGRRFLDSEFVLGVEPRPGNRIEKEFFTLDCDGEDKKHALCRGRTGKLTVMGSTSSRSAVAMDLDDDGDLDLLTNEWNDHPQVLLSNLSEKRQVRFLKIKLVGTRSNHDGLGATVKVRAGSKTYTRFHDGKSGYLSQSSMPLYFGLDEATRIDQIDVLWPSGATQVLTEQLPLNTLLTITE